MSEKCITINALEYSDDELRHLSYARLLGLTAANAAIDHLADGGAQLILSSGRETAEEVFPDGLMFELTEEDTATLDVLFADATLQQAVAYSSELISTASTAGTLRMVDVIMAIQRKFPKLSGVESIED